MFVDEVTKETVFLSGSCQGSLCCAQLDFHMSVLGRDLVNQPVNFSKVMMRGRHLSFLQDICKLLLLPGSNAPLQFPFQRKEPCSMEPSIKKLSHGTVCQLLAKFPMMPLLKSEATRFSVLRSRPCRRCNLMTMLSPEFLKFESHCVVQCLNHLMIWQLLHWHAKQVSGQALLESLPVHILCAAPLSALQSLLHRKPSGVWHCFYVRPVSNIWKGDKSWGHGNLSVAAWESPTIVSHSEHADQYWISCTRKSQCVDCNWCEQTWVQQYHPMCLKQQADDSKAVVQTVNCLRSQHWNKVDHST